MIEQYDLQAQTNIFILEWLSYIQKDGGEEPVAESEYLDQLGCAYVLKKWGETQNRTVIVPERISSIESAQKILPVLLKLAVQKHELESITLASLLHGIHANALLPILLRSEDSTYDFVVGLLLFVEFYEPLYPLDALVADLMCETLNNWLKPAHAWEKLPAAAELAKYFFGNAIHLFLDGTIDNGDVDEALVGEIVARVRPSFLPGLCPTQAHFVAGNLPEMDIAP